jgi:hypothetical protein
MSMMVCPSGLIPCPFAPIAMPRRESVPPADYSRSPGLLLADAYRDQHIGGLARVAGTLICGPQATFAPYARQFIHDNNILVAVADVPSVPRAAHAWRRSCNGPAKGDFPHGAVPASKPSSHLCTSRPSLTEVGKVIAPLQTSSVFEVSCATGCDAWAQ